VYYLSESLLKAASSLERDALVSVGTCFGKFTKTGKFRLHITALDYLAQYSKYKIWIKPQGEMSFLYGNNVLKVRPTRSSNSNSSERTACQEGRAQREDRRLTQRLSFFRLLFVCRRTWAASRRTRRSTKGWYSTT
jgi:hypothetical protein